MPCWAAGQFERQGYKFDVGSSMMFGLSDAEGGANLITRALANIGKRVPTVEDPSQVLSPPRSIANFSQLAPPSSDSLCLLDFTLSEPVFIPV